MRDRVGHDAAGVGPLRDDATVSAEARTGSGSPRHILLLCSIPQRNNAALAAWIGAALNRGDKVLCKHAPRHGAVLRRLLENSGLDTDVLDSGQVELVDAEVMGARCGGRHVQLYELHAELAELAVREGYAGLAMTGDGPALRALTRDRDELLAHERDIERLTVDQQIRALCRYHPSTEESVLAEMLTIHRDIEDDIWTATIADGQLWVRGELDLSNAGRLAHVLHAGITHGFTVVNLSRLEFCAVAGVRVFLEAADVLTCGCELVLVGVKPLVSKAFAMTGGGEHPGLRLVSQERSTSPDGTGASCSSRCPEH